MIREFLRSLERLSMFQPLANLLLRIALFVYMIIHYGNRLITGFSLSSEFFYLSVIYIVLSLLIVIDFFTPRSAITRLASLALFIITLAVSITLLLIGREVSENVGSRILLMAVAFYFLTSSKKRSRKGDEEDEGPLPLMMR